MSQEVVVFVRRARPGDAAARAALLRDVYAEYNTDAFLLFFFQEVILEGVVLCGAVLFIFMGASPAACALLAPAAAALVALAVRLHHRHLAHKHAQRMVKEWAGWVAETRAPAHPAGPPPGATVRLVARADADADTDTATRPDGDHDDDDDGAAHFKQVVGTVSVWAERGGGGGGCACARLAGLCVALGWRRRGVGGALAGAARAAASARGLAELHALVSELQGGARALLQANGWRCRGAGRLPVPSGLLSLPVAHLVAELPHA